MTIKQQKDYKEDRYYEMMVTMWILNKPEGFNLSDSYERLPIESSQEYSGDNYSFIKSITPISNGFQSYLIGQYLEMRDTKEYPTEQGLEQRSFSYPSLFIFKVHISDSKIFCMGSNIEIIKDILKRHSQKEDFLIEPINLNKIELGFQRGLIPISGQRYTFEQGTLLKMVKKVEPVSFDYDESSFESGDDISREYLEILVTIEEIAKRFRVYPNGKITYWGKFQLEQTPFIIFKRVYDKIMETISLVEDNNE